MNLDLWLDGPAVIITSGPKRIVEPSGQFISKLNCLNSQPSATNTTRLIPGEMLSVKKIKSRITSCDNTTVI